MPSTKIENIVRPGYAVAFVLIIISYALFFYSLKQSKDSRSEIEQANNTIKIVGDISSAYKDVETGMRGYLLVGDIKFLDPYYAGLKTVDSSITRLEKVIDRSDRTVLRLFNDLKQLCNNKQKHTSGIISYYQTNDKRVSETLKDMMGASKANMDSLRSTVSLLKADQAAELNSYEKSQNSTNNSTRLLAIISLLIVAILGTYSLVTFNSENKAKRQSEDVNKIYAAELEKRIEQLGITNKELDRHRRIEKFVATGRMAATMAHEIKNPLNNISLAVDQLNDTYDKDSEESILMQIIKRNTTRINGLVTDLLNSTRYLQLNFITISINEVIDQTLEVAKDRLQLQHVQVIKKYDPNICNVVVDRDKIGIAFLNIIINAIEAMDGKAGTIEIKTESKENSCFVTITDNAGGMSPEVLGKLFEPFTTTKAKGTGLGLTNAQNIILNHRGLIHVESELKKGSSFIIQLPFNQEG